MENQLYRSQRLDALGTLSSGIAHDFNNILSYMLVYVDLIAHDVDAQSFARKNLDQISEAIDRAAELVRQMLIFSRQMDGQRIVFDAVPAVRDTLRLFSASLPKNIALKTACGEKPLLMEGDPTHLRQVVMNLCANARDAMSEKGGVLNVELSVFDLNNESHPAFFPAGVTAKAWLHLLVSDDGIGMDEKTVERIFEPFFTTKPPGKGTGLGMAVVHSIVGSYGGVIRIQSEPEKGTMIEVYLPRSENEMTGESAG